MNQSTIKKITLFVACAGAFVSAAPMRAETFTLQDASVADIQKAMADGALSSAELVSLYLNRIAVYDEYGPTLNGAGTLNAQALAEAAEVDATIATSDASKPLRGIPFVVKDLIDAKGLPTTDGLAAMLDTSAKEDAFVVKKLRESGAILLGKANVVGWMAGGSMSSAFGQGRNPYNPIYVPTGSSIGSGIMPSANMTALAVGSETTDSIRSPAAYNGLVGFKPSYGMISKQGIMNYKPETDVVGPIVRSVTDAALMLDAMVATDPTDGAQQMHPEGVATRPTSFTTALKTNALQGVRLGIPRYYLGGESLTDGVGDLDPSVAADFEQAKAVLQALGATIVEVDRPTTAPVSDDRSLPEFSYFPTFFLDRSIYYPEHASRYVAGIARLESDTVPTFQALIDLVYTDAYQAEHQDIYAVDGWLPFINEFTPVSYEEDYDRWLEVDAAFDRYRNENITSVMEENDLDGFVYPTMPIKPWTIEADINGTSGYAFYGTAANGAGIPAVTVPMGFDDQGTPNGLTFMGDRFDDAKVLGYAYAYEQATKHRVAPTEYTPALAGETIEYSTAQPPESRPEMSAPTLSVSVKSSVKGKGKKASLVVSGRAVDASGLSSLKVYVNGKKISAKATRNWKATVKVSKLREMVRGDATTVQVTVVAKDVYGNTSTTTKTVKLPKTV